EAEDRQVESAPIVDGPVERGAAVSGVAVQRQPDDAVLAHAQRVEEAPPHPPVERTAVVRPDPEILVELERRDRPGVEGSGRAALSELLVQTHRGVPGGHYD